LKIVFSIINRPSESIYCEQPGAIFMHEEHPSGPESVVGPYLRSWILAAASLVLVLAFIAYFFFLSNSPPATTSRVSGPAQINESGVETARQGLSRQADLNACRSALQKINAELGEKPALRPPALTKEQKDWLRANLHLSAEELSEVESSHYTRLDNHHLFSCFLMRDAADALEVKGVRGKAGGPAVREKPLDQAVRAFAWVMREVRLRPDEGEAIPPSFVVRRGWGTALERALVFLALLEQLGDPGASQRELLGFLLRVPNAKGKMHLWACGVVVGDGQDVYLFDPYLGLPLPGPKGEGVATLAQARQQSEILVQLNVNAKYRYPVTQEQAQAAQADLVCALSALSPRMRYLQDKLLAPAVRVRLANDAAKDAERIRAACSSGAAKPVIVRASKELCTVLRRFLPPDDGGTDGANREQFFLRDLVPWSALPAVFQDERLFPQESPLGLQVRYIFANSFVAPTMEPGQSRDLLLRGRYSSAEEKLVGERAAWRSMVEQRANSRDLQEQFQAWLDNAIRLYAALVRAKSPSEREQAEKQVQKLWGDRSSWPVHVLLNSAAAAVRNQEVAYQLGLCNQEQAEQLQARIDLQARAGLPPYQPDIEKAQAAWQRVVDNWKSFEEEHPTHRDSAAARRLRGRAEALLGDHQAAIASWNNVSDCPTEMEKLASLYLARQWQSKHADKSK
jgi:hypothetical protein